MSESKQTYTGSYCSNCGAKLKGADLVCPSCAKVRGDAQYEGIPRIGAARKGYSDITDDESFSAYRKNTIKILAIALPVIALIVVVVLVITGLSPVVAVVTGIILLLVMLIIAVVTMRKKPSWEGTVLKKTYTRIRRKGADTHKYEIRFRTDDGKNKKQVWRSHSDVYNYLQENDKVRYLGNIGGMNAYEKYDKSGDEFIPCVCCGKMADTRYTYCTMCGARLLK